jgi:hypothetical protein
MFPTSRQVPLIMTASVLGLGVSWAAMRTGPAARGDVGTPGAIRCFRTVDGGRYAPERALAKARQVLRRRTLTNQSGTIHLTPRTYAVEEITQANVGSPSPLGRRYARLIRNRCGELQAERSWLVLVHLSAAQFPLPDQPLLMVRTADGWRLANPL